MPIYFPNGAYTIRSTTYPDSYVFLEGPDAEVTGSKEDPPQTVWTIFFDHGPGVAY